MGLEVSKKRALMRDYTIFGPEKVAQKWHMVPEKVAHLGQIAL